MKKFIAVFLAILMAFSVMSLTVYAEEPVSEETTTVAQEENTTRNILNDDGLVVPVNETQLKVAFIYKIVEKLISFVMGIFGKEADDALSDAVAGFAAWIDEAISNLSEGLAE